jgi:hypothetical protein
MTLLPDSEETQENVRERKASSRRVIGESNLKKARRKSPLQTKSKKVDQELDVVPIRHESGPAEGFVKKPVSTVFSSGGKPIVR